MNFSGKTRSFSQHSAELRFHSVYTKTVELPSDKCQTQNTERVKPVSLIEIWFQIKSERGAGLVPDSIIVACDYTETVITWSQVGVVGDAARTAIDPVVI